jgi:hypothetical protein
MKELDLCPACFEGKLVLRTGPGRTVPDPRGPFEVPASFALLQCNHCGEIWLDAEQAEALASLKTRAAGRLGVPVKVLNPVVQQFSTTTVYVDSAMLAIVGVGGLEPQSNIASEDQRAQRLATTPWKPVVPSSRSSEPPERPTHA